MEYDIEKALYKFKETTGFDFMEILKDEAVLKEFYNNNNYDQLKEYLQEAEITYDRIKEIFNDFTNKKI